MENCGVDKHQSTRLRSKSKGERKEQDVGAGDQLIAPSQMSTTLEVGIVWPSRMAESEKATEQLNLSH